MVEVIMLGLSMVLGIIGLVGFFLLATDTAPVPGAEPGMAVVGLVMAIIGFCGAAVLLTLAL